MDEQTINQLKQLLDEADKMIDQFSMVHEEIAQQTEETTEQRMKRLEIMSGISKQNDDATQELLEFDQHIFQNHQQSSMLQDTNDDYNESDNSIISSVTQLQPQNASNILVDDKIDRQKQDTSRQQKSAKPPKQPNSQIQNRVVSSKSNKQQISNQQIQQNKQNDEFDDNFREEVNGNTQIILQSNEDENVNQQQEENALMTEIDPKFIQESEFVESILQDDYLSKVQQGYSIPDELTIQNETINEQMSQYNDEKFTEIHSIASQRSILLQKPKNLSQQTDQLFQKLHSKQLEVELQIPQIKGQPDFLREQMRDRQLNDYLKTVDTCLKFAENDNNYKQVTSDELKQLLTNVDDFNNISFDPYVQQQKIEDLLLSIEDKVNQLEYQNENADSQINIMDEIHNNKQLQEEQIQRDEQQFTRTQQMEEKLKQQINVQNNLQKTIQDVRNALGSSGLLPIGMKTSGIKRVGSAKPIMQEQKGKVDVKQIPNQLKSINK